MVEQLTIIAENKKGTMLSITQNLADSSINMNTLITNDSPEFGIIRMLVDDCERALTILKEQGYMCRKDQVLAVEISDEAGSLNKLLKHIADGNINIDYLYVTHNSFSKLPVAIMKTQDMMEVEEYISARGYKVLQDIE